MFSGATSFNQPLHAPWVVKGYVPDKGAFCGHSREKRATRRVGVLDPRRKFLCSGIRDGPFKYKNVHAVVEDEREAELVVKPGLDLLELNCP